MGYVVYPPASSSSALYYVDRGDIADADITQGNASYGDYTDWDLTGIIPTQAYGKLIHFRINVGAGASPRSIVIKPKGMTNNVNLAYAFVPQNTSHGQDCMVVCDSNGFVQYLVSTQPTTLNLLVRGWWRT